jgi:hypothetical protein
MSSRTPALALLLAASLSGGALAQTGPFAAGEIIIHNPNGNDAELLRVDPTTGQTAQLAPFTYWGGWADSLEYDPYRGGLIVPMSYGQASTFDYQPWVVQGDGSAVPLPGIVGDYVHGLAPAADGRLYFQRGFGPGTQIEYYDAGNSLHVLMDETGAAPVSLAVEHMLYHAPSNALLVSQNPWWSGAGCTGTTENSIYRLPLTADGSQLAGPITCTSIIASSLSIMGLDWLPDGRVLVTSSGTTTLGFAYPDKLWAVDPVTLSSSLWSQCDPADLNGGVYSDALGKAVVFYDNPNELRTFGAGQGGGGTTLPTTMPIGDGTTGFSPASNMTDINALGPGCAGYALEHGVGLAGTGGRVPTLGAIGCPDLGLTYSVVIDQARGGAVGVLFVGLGTISAPFKGGTFYVGGLVFTLDLVMSGALGATGKGQMNLPVLLTDPAFSGLEIVLQAGFADAAAVKGASLSNALRVAGF